MRFGESTGASDQRTDIATKVTGMAAAFAAAFVARKIITFVWTKVTGKEPPVSPEDPEVGIKEALGWAVVTGVGMETARLLATRAAAKQVRARQAGQAGK
jgi:hypothetical protein